jgi:hypothetical protein
MDLRIAGAALRALLIILKKRSLQGREEKKKEKKYSMVGVGGEWVGEWGGGRRFLSYSHRHPRPPYTFSDFTGLSCILFKPVYFRHEKCNAPYHWEDFAGVGDTTRLSLL